MLQKPDISAGLMGHLARMQALPFLPVYFNWNFPIEWPAITNFKFLREMDWGENDSLVECNAWVRCRINMQHRSFGLSDL